MGLVEIEWVWLRWSGFGWDGVGLVGIEWVWLGWSRFG